MKNIFISHASEDKDEFVRPLAEALKKHGMFQVWYDEYSLKWGDSLLQSISTGLSECDYAIVVFSKHFFEKSWPKSELDGLFALESVKGKIILPIWKNITKEEVTQYSPIIANRLAMSSAQSIGKIINELEIVIDATDRAITARNNLHLAKFSDALSNKKEALDSIRKTKTRPGTDKAKEAAITLVKEFELQIDSILPDIMGNDFLRQHFSSSNTHCSISYHLLSSTLVLGALYNNNIMNMCNEATMRLYLSEINRQGSIPEYYPISENIYAPYIDKFDAILWSNLETENSHPLTHRQVIEESIEAIAIALKDYL